MPQRLRSTMRILVPTLCALAVVWIATSAYLYRVMKRPPEQFGQFMAKLPGPVPFILFPFETLWLRARAGVLNIGDPAPDFTLAKLDRSEKVQLSSFTRQSRPVVLIFGSYT